MASLTSVGIDAWAEATGTAPGSPSRGYLAMSAVLAGLAFQEYLGWSIVGQVTVHRRSRTL